MTTILTKTVKAGTVEVVIAFGTSNMALDVTMNGKTVADNAVVMPKVTIGGNDYRHILQETKVILTAAEYDTIQAALDADRKARYQPTEMSEMDKFTESLRSFERNMDRADSAW